MRVLEFGFDIAERDDVIVQSEESRIEALIFDQFAWEKDDASKCTSLYSVTDPIWQRGTEAVRGVRSIDLCEVTVPSLGSSGSFFIHKFHQDQDGGRHTKKSSLQLGRV